MRARNRTRMARLRRFAERYRKLYARLSWPLRVPLIAASAAAGFLALIVMYELAIIAIGCLIVFGVMWVMAGGGRWGGESAFDKQFHEDMANAEQRRQEDHGQV